MDKQLLQQYFKCINLSKFCETYNIGYKHMQEAMTGHHNIGKRLEEKIQTAQLNYHDDLIELSDKLMQKPKKKKVKKV